MEVLGRMRDYRFIDDVPIGSSVPDSVKPMYGLVLSSRRGPPVKYQIIHIAQKIAKAFSKNPIGTVYS